ncbi:MAG: hypothetical protein ACLS9I_05825 [Adlercreutzia equolifaciens]
MSKKSLHLWQRRQWVGPSSSSATRAGSFSQGASEGDAAPSAGATPAGRSSTQPVRKVPSVAGANTRRPRLAA